MGIFKTWEKISRIEIRDRINSENRYIKVKFKDYNLIMYLLILEAFVILGLIIGLIKN